MYKQKLCQYQLYELFLLFLFFSSQELDKQLVHLTTRVNLMRKMKANIDRTGKSNWLNLHLSLIYVSLSPSLPPSLSPSLLPSLSLSGPPGAPRDVQLIVSSAHSLTVRFSEPEFSNGASVTRYKGIWGHVTNCHVMFCVYIYIYSPVE